MASIVIYILLALAPSIVWLLFFLRKDSHPEPKGMVLKIFIYGMLAALPALILENLFLDYYKKIGSVLIGLIFWAFYVAIIEELMKYLVIRDKVLKNPEFDEPVDAILYMIIAGLGFAATENIFILSIPQNLQTALHLGFFRFISATFLHALVSGIIGYYLALSLLKKKTSLLIKGILIAVVLHALYNFSIMYLKDNSVLIFLCIGVILIGSLLFVLGDFRKVKKLKSICNIKKHEPF